MTKCRLCLNETGSNYLLMIDPIDSKLLNISITEALWRVFSINLKGSPCYPHRVCLECHTQIVAAFNLKSVILKVNEQFEREINPLEDNESVEELKQLNEIKKEQESDESDEEPIRIKRKIKQESTLDINADLVEVQLTVINSKEYKHQHQSPKKYYKSYNQDKEKRKSESVKKKICKKCHFNADCLLTLMKHIDDSKQNCSDYYEPTKECYICHKKFMLDVKKREHVRRDHHDYVMKDCPHCIRARLKTSTAYELHVRQHFAQPDYLCVILIYFFLYYYKLLFLFYLIQTNCGKGFFKKELYELHMRHHDDNFWMYCDLCEYKCKIKNSMSIHLKHHLDIRPYVCDKCSKSFHKSNALSQHIFQVHKTTNKGCYRCEKCNYCFLHRRDIIRHNVYCEGQSKNPVNCPRVKYSDLDPNCVIKELLDDESHVKNAE